MLLALLGSYTASLRRFISASRLILNFENGASLKKSISGFPWNLRWRWIPQTIWCRLSGGNSVPSFFLSSSPKWICLGDNQDFQWGRRHDKDIYWDMLGPCSHPDPGSVFGHESPLLLLHVFEQQSCRKHTPLGCCQQAGHQGGGEDETTRWNHPWLVSECRTVDVDVAIICIAAVDHYRKVKIVYGVSVLVQCTL